MADRTCSVDGCERTNQPGTPLRFKRGMCSVHYQRWLRYGDPLREPQPGRKPERFGCVIEGCDGEHFGRGYCQKHYNRWYHNGDPLYGHDRFKGDGIGYAAAHWRVRRERGNASDHPCIDCGEQAESWSYNHSGGDRERIGTGPHEGYPYSLRTSDYDPRCTACHNRYDRGRMAS